MSDLSVCCQSKNIVGEAPFWSAKEQALYWVDIIEKTLNRLTVEEGEIKTWYFPELVCGAVLRENGEILIALRHTLGSFNIDTEQFTPLLDVESEIPTNRNNEMKCDPEGRLWLGTMQDNVCEDGSGKEISNSAGNLYCIYPDLRIEKRREGIGISNTLAWSPDDSTFYFADSMADTIWSHDYDKKTGEISNKKVILSNTNMGVPDGSAMDNDGWLWNTRFGEGCVLRISPDGLQIERYDLPITNPTSCAFGGADLSILYITSACFTLSEEQLAENENEGGIIALQTKVMGLPVADCVL